MKTKKIVALLLSLAVMLASFSLLCVGVSAVEVQNQIDLSTYEDGAEADLVTVKTRPLLFVPQLK